MNDLILYTYALSAMIEMVVLEFVIRQVDYDSINRKDPEWVRWARRSTFLGGQVYLIITTARAWFHFFEPSWDSVGLIWAGIFILGVNVISLHLRTPPNIGGYRALTTIYSKLRKNRVI